MLSPENEKIPFLKPVNTKEEVEVWLMRIQESMIEAMRKKMK